MNPKRLDDLLNRYIDRRLTPEEKHELEASLLESADARRRFWDLMWFEEVLEESAEIQRSAEWLTPSERNRRKNQPQALPARTHGPIWTWWTELMSGHPALTAAAAGLFVLVTVTTLVLSRAPSPTEPTSNGVAVLASALDVQWAANQAPLRQGAALPPGRIRLAKGVLGIEFYNGVRLTMEGPADVELNNMDEATCHMGKLRVLVPKLARNFRVLTPTLDVLDLGTEFGMDVVPAKSTEIHVFEGKVEWSGRDPNRDALNKSRLVAGQAIREDSSGIARIAARPAEFVSSSELVARVQSQVSDRLHQWNQFAVDLRKDPRLVLFYRFERQRSTRGLLQNESEQDHHGLDGVIVGCDWAEGRWPGHSALEFKHPSDRVRVLIPGEFDSLTYVAWLRVDRIDTKFSAILLTDRFESGAPHWQITGGRIRLGIGDSVGRASRRAIGHGVETAQTGVDYDSPLVLTNAELGHWHQLAVVIDGKDREVRHYLDGQLLSQAPMVVAQKLRIGAAELGNWGLPAAEELDPQPIRNLNGRMDEFLIFKSALPSAEIQALYERGRVNPMPSSPVLANNG